MSIQKILSVATLASVTLLSGAYSHADDSKYYVGVEFGTADHESNISIVSGAGSVTDSDSGSKLFFGYRLTSNVALELQYTNLGESASSFTDGSTVTFGNNSVNILAGEAGATTSEVTSFGVSGVYQFNVESGVRPFVKLGLHSWDVENSTTSSGLVAGNTSGTDIFYGVGLDIAVAKQLALSVSYDVYTMDDDSEAIDEISTFGVGVNYKF
jgi:hypothetical protein